MINRVTGSLYSSSTNRINNQTKSNIYFGSGELSEFEKDFTKTLTTFLQDAMASKNMADGFKPAISKAFFNFKKIFTAQGKDDLAKSMENLMEKTDKIK